MAGITQAYLTDADSAAVAVRGGSMLLLLDGSKEVAQGLVLYRSVPLPPRCFVQQPACTPVSNSSLALGVYSSAFQIVSVALCYCVTPFLSFIRLSSRSTCLLVHANFQAVCILMSTISFIVTD